MRNQWICVIFTGLSIVFPGLVSAATTPQPAPSCVTAVFSNSSSSGWSNISLVIKNSCTSTIDFQNSTITFTNSKNLNASVWGTFNSLSYPSNTLQVTSQPATSGYTSTITLQFPTGSWVNSKLAPNQSFTLFYGAPTPDYVANSVKIYTGTVIQTGEIDLSSNTVQPSGVTTTSATVDIVSGGQTISKVQLPWNGQLQITNLAVANYTIQPESVTDSLGNVYQGTATPSSISLTANQKISTVVSYTPVTTLGSINVQALALPSALSGYTTNPSITLTRTDTNASFVKTIPWNTTTTVSQLPNQITYSFSTPVITYNSNNCTATFNPSTLTSNASSPSTTQLSYTCVPVQQDKITLNVSGLPSNANSVTITLTPNDGSSTVTQAISVSGGSGSDTVMLNDGVIYNVSASSVSGYSVTFNPQPLTAKSGVTENITWQKQTGGRIIAYMAGWKTPPSATDVAAAGYTHVLVAFGVFSTTQPGKIVPAFDTISTAYIAQLRAAGIKVSLSLGGASTGLSGTTIDFHSALSLASSPTVFQQTFVQSVESIVNQYGFDGIDIDIETGLNASGTFTNPTGDILVLANIINKLHADNPALLISLVPQTANISATTGFNATFGNYSSLIMQTASSLSWVGVQVYNSGCMMGINDVCYDPSQTNSTDFSVAMAVDLLTNWPAKLANGQFTGFQPYISYLNPSQVVLGYPASNSTGGADAAPITPTTTIKYAIQCLRTGIKSANSCTNYVPPATYPGMGGVFEWEISYDQNNNYNFAKSLSACVLQGNCN